jgi:hypothetical protein
MTDHTTPRFRLGAIAAIGAVVAIAVIMYVRARATEEGTTQDDSSAAELGTKGSNGVRE